MVACPDLSACFFATRSGATMSPNRPGFGSPPAGRGRISSIGNDMTSVGRGRSTPLHVEGSHRVLVHERRHRQVCLWVHAHLGKDVGRQLETSVTPTAGASPIRR